MAGEQLAYGRRDAARLLGIGLTALDDLVNAGRLPSYKLNSRRYFTHEALVALVAELQAETDG